MTFLYITVDGRGKISNKFLLIFPSFLCLLSTKLMAKWSRVPSQLSWGQKLSKNVNFDIFLSLNFSKFLKFSGFFVPVPFYQLVRICTLFLLICIDSKDLQSNFEVPVVCGSLIFPLPSTVICLFKWVFDAKLVHITSLTSEWLLFLMDWFNKFFKWVFCEKQVLQMLHSKDFSFSFYEWIEYVYSNFVYLVTKLSSNTNLKAFFPSWTDRICLFKSIFKVKLVHITKVAFERFVFFMNHWTFQIAL